jgi:hypothetical protein
MIMSKFLLQESKYQNEISEEDKQSLYDVIQIFRFGSSDRLKDASLSFNYSNQN